MAMTLSMEESVTWEKKEEKEKVVVSELEKVFFFDLNFLFCFSLLTTGVPRQKDKRSKEHVVKGHN